MVGPNAHLHQWDEPLAKFKKATHTWCKIIEGLNYAAAAYATYCLPTLSFVAQLSAPNPEVLQAEEECIRHLVRGPTEWCSLQDLAYLKDL